MIEDPCNGRNIKVIFAENVEWREDKSEFFLPVFSDMVFHFDKIQFW